jgi:hypothetical protein
MHRGSFETADLLRLRSGSCCDACGPNGRVEFPSYPQCDARLGGNWIALRDKAEHRNRVEAVRSKIFVQTPPCTLLYVDTRCALIWRTRTSCFTARSETGSKISHFARHLRATAADTQYFEALGTRGRPRAADFYCLFIIARPTRRLRQRIRNRLRVLIDSDQASSWPQRCSP